MNVYVVKFNYFNPVKGWNEKRECFVFADNLEEADTKYSENIKKIFPESDLISFISITKIADKLDFIYTNGRSVTYISNGIKNTL